ncbi:MAG TPA: putative DNA-binding domain-containing protein [Gammaproteobacteria bacterium]|nr:putative DNA-binding domain-containing protein [Gammaproteobacteria bacterium]
MPERPRFQQVQYAFTAHVRDPEGTPAPADVAGPGMALYCDLAFTNIKTFIADNFPVVRKVMEDSAWERMARDYFIRHVNHTPLFSQLGNEFLEYLEKERDGAGDPPFLLELAHYEWMESALRIDTHEISYAGVDRGGDLLAGRPVLSPLAWPLAYAFPVHRISPDFKPRAAPAQPTYLVIHRNDHGEVGFMELNPVSARLLELIGSEDAQSGEAMLRQIAGELKHPDPRVVVEGGHAMMKEWLAKQVLLGVRSGI